MSSDASADTGGDHEYSVELLRVLSPPLSEVEDLVVTDGMCGWKSANEPYLALIVIVC